MNREGNRNRTRARLGAGRAVVEAAGALDDGLLGDRDDVGGDRVELSDVSGCVGEGSGEGTHAEALEQVLGLLVDVESAGLAVLGEVEGGDLGHVLILALALLFLELERDTADGTALDTLHQMCRVAGDLVAEALGGDDGNLSIR
jgi:hypothetical protein